MSKFKMAIALMGFASLGAAAAAHAQVVKIDGSSTVFPVTEAVAEEFQIAKRGKIHVTVGISGTGGGFKKFCRGEIDISNASRPILKSEMEACKAAGIEYIELPIAFDALTIVIHPKNAFVKSISVDELKKMWEPSAQGRITRWNQINPAWPDAEIKLYGAGADSGTFDYFTEAIVGKAKSSRGDYTASEDDNVLVQGVSRDVNAIGYFGFAYYAENKDKLKAVPVAPKAGERAVEPSAENVLNGSYQPLSRPIFIYVNAKALSRPEVKEFAEFYLKNGANLAREVKYVPLPERSYKLGTERLSKVQKGTVFAGKAEIHVKIDDLFSRPLGM